MRPALLRFALLQLRNNAHAEDVVQGNHTAVLEKPDSFAGRSEAHRTYVIYFEIQNYRFATRFWS